jgi:FG-GAP repeat
MHPHLSHPLARSRVLLVAALILIAGGAARADAAYVQSGELTATDGAANTKFGARVAISGNTMAVASLGDDAPATPKPGAVYVFEKPASGWSDAQRTATLTLPAGAGSPTAVAMSGDTIAVGARDAKVGANDKQGAVFVFAKPPGGWQGAQPVATLTASDGAAQDEFGLTVAVDGDAVVTGSPRHKVGAKAEQGAAYLFVKPAAGWASGHETAELTASDGAASDHLLAVGIDGDTIVAGAQNHMVANQFARGEAYVFVKPAAGWTSSTETARLTTTVGAKEDFLGATVSISGDTVIAGAPDQTPVGGAMHQGVVDVFVKPPAGWVSATETAQLSASDGRINDILGADAVVSGDTVVTGATSRNVGQNGSQGAVYVFKRPPGADWRTATEDQSLVSSDGGSIDLFGNAIGISGNVAVVGAPFHKVGDNERAGAAYVFGVPPSIAIASPAEGAVFTRGTAVTASYSCTPPAAATIATCLGPVPDGARIDTSGVGRHTFTVSALDSEGISATRGVSYTVVRPKAPSITAVKQSHARWRERGKRPVGTTFSLRLDQRARVALRFTRRGKRAGTLTRSAHAGLNRIHFAGHLSRAKKLAPGRYMMRITATNAAGQSATSRRLTFTIVTR